MAQETQDARPVSEAKGWLGCLVWLAALAAAIATGAAWQAHRGVAVPAGEPPGRVAPSASGETPAARP